MRSSVRTCRRRRPGSDYSTVMPITSAASSLRTISATACSSRTVNCGFTPIGVISMVHPQATHIRRTCLSSNHLQPSFVSSVFRCDVASFVCLALFLLSVEEGITASFKRSTRCFAHTVHRLMPYPTRKCRNLAAYISCSITKVASLGLYTIEWYICIPFL